jgi:hypothetical protein
VIVVLGVAHNCMVNGILRLLCKRHYPGVMDIAEVRQPASSWEHFIAAPDGREPGVKRTMGKSSWHYIYKYIIFIAPGFEIMPLFMFLCRISTDARRE